MGEDDVCGLIDKFAIFRDAFGVSRSKVIRRCTQPWPKWPYSGRLVAVAFEQFLELAEIAAQLLGRHGGILPTFPSMMFPGDETVAPGRIRALPRPVWLPHRVPARCRSMPKARAAWVNSSAVRRLLRVIGTEFAHQKSAAFRQQQHVLDRQILSSACSRPTGRQSLPAQWACNEALGHVIGGDKGIGEAEDDQAAVLRAVVERAACFEHGDTGALSSHQRARDVKTVLG